MKYRFEGVKALSYCGIMCALCTIFIVGGLLLPGSCILSLLVLPLFTSMVVLNVNYKYTLVYSLSVIALSFIDPMNALFIAIPSVITGLTFGYLIKKYIQGYYIIFISAIILLLLQLLAQLEIKFFFEQDMEKVMGALLKFSEATFHYLYLVILFLVSLSQATVTYVITTNELKKLSYQFNEKKNQFIEGLIITFILLCASIGLYFVNIPFSYLTIAFTLYFGVILGYYNFSYYNKKFVLYQQIPLYVISLFAFFAGTSYLDKYISVYLILIFPFSEILVSLSIIINQLCIKKGTINETIFDKLN